MKRFPLFHPICFGTAVLSLILPYKSYDLYSGNGWTSTGQYLEHVNESGLTHPESLIALGIMLITSIVVLIRQNLATGILGLIMGLGLLLYMPILLFILTFELFSPKENVNPGLGYVILVLSALTYFGFLIRNLVLVIRNRKNKPEQKMQSDLLDDI